MKRKTEYKKLALALIVIFSVLFISAGRMAAFAGLDIDSSVDTALVYVIFGAYAAYCTASATDKYGMNKYGVNYDNENSKGDGTE